MKKHYTMPLMLILMAFLISPLRSFSAGDGGEKLKNPKIVLTQVQDNLILPEATFSKDVKIKTHNYSLKVSNANVNNLQSSTLYTFDTWGYSKSLL